MAVFDVYQKKKSTACRCQRSDVRSKRIKSLSGKRGIVLSKMHFELSPLIVWIALWIVIAYSKFEVNIFSNYKMSYNDDDADDNDDAMAITIPRVFSENSRTKDVRIDTTFQRIFPIRLVFQNF